jgi:hypothetical protein
MYKKKIFLKDFLQSEFFNLNFDEFIAQILMISDDFKDFKDW